jgi:DNA invertase Pin-like site-specific DNA recombinase
LTKIRQLIAVKYVRVSRLEQDTFRQEINSDDFSKVYVEKASGAIKHIERDEAKKLLNNIEKVILQKSI